MSLFKGYSYTLGYTDQIMSVGATQQLTLSMSPSNKPIPTATWDSSDPTVATVDENGIVTAEAGRNATIIAEVDGQTVSVDVAVIPSRAGATFKNPETNTVWRVLLPDDGNGNTLIITEHVYNNVQLYNTTNTWTLYECSDLRNNATTGMDVWYNHTNNVGATLRGKALDYAYQDNLGNSVVKGTAGAGVEIEEPGATYSVTANVQKARTVAGDINTQGNGSVFALSISEANEYFSDNTDRAAKAALGYTCNWWLRSPGAGDSYPTAFVGVNGGFFGGIATEGSRGFRPALWIHQ